MRTFNVFLFLYKWLFSYISLLALLIDVDLIFCFRYAKVDRRPLDPPPVVALRLYEVTDEERADGPSEREIENVECVISL